MPQYTKTEINVYRLQGATCFYCPKLLTLEETNFVVGPKGHVITCDDCKNRSWSNAHLEKYDSIFTDRSICYNEVKDIYPPKRKKKRKRGSCKYGASKKRHRKWRIKLYQVQKGACFYCEQPTTFTSTNLDHVIPVSKGGARVLTNTVVACIGCNNSKGNRSPNEKELIRCKALHDSLDSRLRGLNLPRQ